MPVVDKTVASAERNTDTGGYGSRVALRLPGTTWIDSIFQEPRRKPVHSRGAMRPSFARTPSTDEGTGNAGCALHPQPRVRNKTKHTSVVTEGSPEQPGIPCARESMGAKTVDKSTRRG